MALADPLEPHGFLAYETLVFLLQDEPDSERVQHLREFFINQFHGFGDMDPDDAVDIDNG